MSFVIGNSCELCYYRDDLSSETQKICEKCIVDENRPNFLGYNDECCELRRLAEIGERVESVLSVELIDLMKGTL